MDIKDAIVHLRYPPPMVLYMGTLSNPIGIAEFGEGHVAPSPNARGNNE